MSILSPIDNQTTAKFRTSIVVEKIIDQYEKDLHIDVRRFFNGIEKVNLYECTETGYLFYYPYNLTGDEFFYDELKKQMPLIYNSSYYADWKWEYDQCLKFVRKSDHVYEIGCGHGNFLKKLKDLGIYNVSGTELNHASVNKAKNEGLAVEYITVQEKSAQSKNSFDVVCSFQVLEHIADINSFLDACISILKPGGKLLIAVPYNNPYLFKHDMLNTLNLPPHHMGLWGKKAFQKLVNFFPVKLEKLIIETLPSAGYDFEQYFKINKDVLYPTGWPLKSLFDRSYFRWLKRYHGLHAGKNIIAVFQKNE